MTSKDYEAIAAKLRWAYEFADGEESGLARDGARRALSCAVHGIADAMAADNPRFDKRRFVDASMTFCFAADVA